ncbi:protein Son-like [Paramacrobiotus metropolitanus]|uniref:protein Son-like n=1 Tax=Paramacrobiotus metropolitanus TaxID=2943436 RepID=UPI00244594D3|nr:protein Son-like [Paramacrobiotus metropolitanus]XP_055328816.1 protein Son-like [Paramacrobiotus metropolitanus]
MINGSYSNGPLSAIDFLPDEDEVLFVSTPSSSASNTRRKTTWADDGSSTPDQNSSPRSPSSTADRHLMPPPSFIPTRPTKEKSSLAMKPVNFVSNSVQAATFGTTLRRKEDAQRNTITYKYKRPNYVVTDVPDLWTNSAMLVESCATKSPEKLRPPPEKTVNENISNRIPSACEEDSGVNRVIQSADEKDIAHALDEAKETVPVSTGAGVASGCLLKQIFTTTEPTDGISAAVLDVLDVQDDRKNSALDLVNRKRKRDKSVKQNSDKKVEKERSRSKKHRKRSRDSHKKSNDSSGRNESTKKKKEKRSKSEKSGKKKKAKETGNNIECSLLEPEEGEILDATELEFNKNKFSRKHSRDSDDLPSKPHDVVSHRDYDWEVKENRTRRRSSREENDFPHPFGNSHAENDMLFKRHSLERRSSCDRYSCPWPDCEEDHKWEHRNEERPQDTRRSFHSPEERRTPSPDYLPHRSKIVDWEDEERGMSSWFMREQRHREQVMRVKSNSRERSFPRQNLHEVGYQYAGTERDYRREHSHDRSSVASDNHSRSSRSPPRSRSKSTSSTRQEEKRSTEKPKRTPVSFAIKKAAPAPAPKESTDSEGAMKDILDLLEKHLLKTGGKENGEVSSESDCSDTESVVSISKMSVFGDKEKKSHRKRKSSLNTPRRKSVERDSQRQRRRSLSPLSVMTRTRQPRRRSVSPARRRSPAPLSRRQRASSFDTIASSQIDCEKLREAAIKNAIELRRMGKIPPEYTMSAEERALWRSGGKSLEDLTAFCKRMAQRSREGDRESSVASELPVYNHPYHVKDRPLLTEIIMHINNAKAVPVKTQQERIALNLPLRELYPVSTGSNHREMTWQPVISHEREERYAENPVPKKKPTKEKEKPALTLEDQLKAQPPPPDYRIPISFADKLRLLKFQRELAKNPDNPYILNQMQETQQQMLEWANQFTYTGNPGEFTGETAGYNTASAHSSGKQAWARKDQLMNLKPVGGKGQYLLQKMGWIAGQSLGVRQHGTLEPLKMTIKMDKRGLIAQEEIRGKQPTSFRGVKTVSFPGYENQHPCSALNEVCTKNGWGTPSFILVEEGGQPHRKTFLFQVIINGVEYRPTVPGCSKKIAKAEAAKYCLQAIGVELKTNP